MAAFSRRHYTFASIIATSENRGVVGRRYHEIPSFINRTDDDAKTNAQSRSTTKKLSDEDDAPLVRHFEKFSFGRHVLVNRNFFHFCAYVHLANSTFFSSFLFRLILSKLSENRYQSELAW